MNQITEILRETYCVGVLTAPVYAIYWASEAVEDTTLGKEYLKEINNKRIKHGLIPARFPFGHRFF